ncbi:hypothetical protein FKW77_003693 [Venturia effusa]|uniref:CCHC-type domain-containing protein n=1 Tax=Venturia effusa TaxID=50376 RepID=A0A517LJY6_9PEZI|nr:hypothetical protein FKW77_003693 [Venturia effusa]
MPVNTIPRPAALQIGRTVAQSAAGQSLFQQHVTDSEICHKMHDFTTEGPAASSILSAEAGSTAADLLDIPYQDFSAIPRPVNYQWRKDNHKCTACGHDGHLDIDCLVWRIQESTVNETKMTSKTNTERMRVHALMFSTLDSRKCYLAKGKGALPQELRDIIWSFVMAHDSSVLGGRIIASAGMQVVPRCLHLNQQIHREACEVILNQVRVVIHTGGANRGFRSWINACYAHDLVRELEFPLFYRFNPGKLSGLGHLYDQRSLDVDLMLLCTSLRKVTFKLRCAGMTCAAMVQRYSIDRLVGCEHLKEVVIDLAAKKWGPPTDFYSGEEMAQYCRDMFIANEQRVVVTNRLIRGR